MRLDTIARQAALAGGTLFWAGAVLAAGADPELVKKLKPQVVNIEVSVSQGLAGDDSGSWVGTGFVVDAEKGLIATNRHVSGRSPAQYKVNFYNGESTSRVRLMHYDPWHDFAILQVDKTSVSIPLESVTLGESASLKEQDEVFLIGNNEAQEYSVLYGELINTEVDAGDRHSGTFQVTYNNQGGSSGSPIFNAAGEVVGIHYKGTKSTGLELRIEYLKDALRKVCAGGASCRRGDIGCDLDLIKISEAQKHFHLPADIAERIQKSGENIRRAISVEGTVPGSSADGRLQPGDIVVSVDGSPVASDLYAFDKAVDEKTGGKVRIGLVRSGARKEVELAVADAWADRVTRFAQFGGALVHDLTPELRRKYAITGTGAFLNQVESGTSFEAVGANPRTQTRAVVIEAVNGVATPGLASFVREASKLKDQDDINLTVRDYRFLSTAPRALALTLTLKFHPLKQFELNAEGEWVEILPQGPGAR